MKGATHAPTYDNFPVGQFFDKGLVIKGSLHFNSSIMRSTYLLFVLAALLGFTTAKARDKSNDTTARYFIIHASIGNLPEIAMGQS